MERSDECVDSVNEHAKRLHNENAEKKDDYNQSEGLYFERLSRQFEFTRLLT